MKQKTIILFTALAYIVFYLSAYVISEVTSGYVVSVFAILLGPFTFVLLNPPGSWAFPAALSTVPWMLAIAFKKKTVVYIVLVGGAILWLFLGVMGSALQV